MRFGALIALALFVLVPRLAMGLGAPSVVVIPPPPPLGQPPQVPIIDPPANLAAMVGKPIARVTVELEGNLWADVIVPAVTSIKPGDAFTPEAARKALNELLTTGRFASGRLAVEEEGGSINVFFHLLPRKLIAGLHLELHGLRIDRDDILRQADLSEGGEIVGADVGAVSARIDHYFAVHGYPASKTEITMRETADPMRTIVFVDVTPGPPRYIDARRFFVFGTKADPVLAVANGYGVRAGEPADETALDRADAALEQTLRSKGWVRAGVSHDLVWLGNPPHPGRVFLRVRIDGGPLFLPRFEGNEHYDSDTLTAVLGLETETDRSFSHLAEKVRSFYVKRGFLDVEVRVETRGSSQDAFQLIVFHVIEHRRVRVVRRSYPCLKLDAIKNLSSGGPRSPAEIGTEIDSYLDEELPGADLFVDPDPRGVSATIGEGAGQVAIGARPVPLDLKPFATYVADTYDRAAEHVQELYRNEGFLHAQVGPVQIVRARCDARSLPDECRLPATPAPLPVDQCTYDQAGRPAHVDVAPAEEQSTACRPDPARGIQCAPTMQLVIPVKLGPRTKLWDIAFTGVKSVGEGAVADAARLALGDAASASKIEDARRRIVDWYKELGYYYVDVKYTLEPSADNTRARVRFDVNEGDQVIVRAIIIQGLDRTQEWIVRRRVALEVGRPFRASDVRKTQERIATLGVFSAVTVSLSDPYVPQANKEVIVDVVERESQYVEVRPGFSTGEGVRGVLEYGHRNLLGYAWAVTVHLQASYLPDFLILDPQVAANYGPLSTLNRIATRNTVTFAWPEIGLGPTVRAQLDGIYVRDLERDFTLLKASALGTLIWRPVRELQITGGPDYEHNDIHLFDGLSVDNYLAEPQNVGNSDLQRLLRVPDGDSNVVAGRFVITWDRRDNAFNARRGTYAALGVEQVNSYPVQGTAPDPESQYEGHFFRLTQTFAGYIPITSTISLAGELRLGEIFEISPRSCLRPFAPGGPTAAAAEDCTYPDRLFFMGGFDSMRGWLQDTFIPQEYADRIAADANKADTDPTKFTVNQVPLRGGNLMINPRLELRFPIRLPIGGAVFADFGNLWRDPTYIFENRLTLRADVGAGVRVETPVGPLVFDYGINVTRRSYEDFGAFHFAIGLF